MLSRPYQTASVNTFGGVALSLTAPQVVQARYGELLAQKPPPAEQFLLYFEPGAAQLTEQSMALLPTILASVRARKGGEITVMGHADRVGSLKVNEALSVQRAETIRELFVAQGFQPDLVQAVGRGERAPLVPTGDEVTEPQNRRVEH